MAEKLNYFEKYNELNVLKPKYIRRLKDVVERLEQHKGWRHDLFQRNEILNTTHGYFFISNYIKIRLLNPKHEWLLYELEEIADLLDAETKKHAPIAAAN